MKKLLSVAACSVFLGSGCASITRGTTETLVINTEPPGAKAQLSNGLTCNTPCSLDVKRKDNLVINIEKDGYERVTKTLISTVDKAGAAGMAGNLVFGGVIGAGIDAGTGAMKSHKPNPLEVTLVKEGSTETSETE